MKRPIRLLALILFVTAAAAGLLLPRAAAQAPAGKPVDFNRDVRPILSDNCFACHGPDDKQRMARLRFDTREGAFAKPGVIIPGDSANSNLIKRVTSKDPNFRMPPADSGHALNEQQIATLVRWVDEGARWSAHWAYQPPVRPQLPSVSNATWGRNAIDRFILARLEREGLKPSPEADKATLLRRVSLDLTGLPPTPQALDAFLADRSPDAYEKVVDGLLASPHYGERMALMWLDLARYADTHGYHIDSHRDMWPWRDWVIRAFNDNKPYDQFTIEQLAGDLLPNATTGQKIASGFNRNHMINFEGGAIPEEYQTEYVIDRLEATATTWMAMTLGCARCHSHKYDPLTQKEFYQFFAFFNTVSEEGLDGREGNAKPLLPLPTAEQKVRQDELAKAIAAREAELKSEAVTAAQREWEKDYTGRVADSPRNGLAAHYTLDGSLSDISGHYQHGSTIKGDPAFGGGRIGRAVGFDGETQVSFGNVDGFDRNDRFTLASWIKVDSNVPLTLMHKLAGETDRRGWEMSFDDLGLVGIQHWAGKLNVRVIAREPDEMIHLRTTERLSFGDWHHLTLTYDGTAKAAGLRLFIDGKPAAVEIIKDNLAGSCATDGALQIGYKPFGRPFKGQLDDLRLYTRTLAESEIEQLAIRYPVLVILSGVNGKRTKDEAEQVRDYFLTYAASDAYRQQYAELKNLRAQKKALDRSIVTTMVMDEMAKPRETFVLGRGDYRNKTEKVAPGVPAVLPPLPKDAPPNRLTLAKWLVDPQHPLTARVAVNRFWQMLFGIGIVKTSEDFGSQGEPPAHPELLDYLATEFIHSGWDVKATIKLIVTSATYRQSSRVTPELHERDPENRLLARGPRSRLQGELIRDNALAVSGLLNEEIGGPSVLPYQPAGLWEEMAFGDGFSAQAYRQSHGRDLYRRSMYTFWKRTVPPASLLTFDAPDREKCVARRALTNTPLQALVLMNDPTYVEASRALAMRTMREGGKDTTSRLRYAFRLATARWPSAQEANVLRDLLAKQMAVYRRDSKAAAALLKVGESPLDQKLDVAEAAAWTVVASAILNLDETISRE
jgi:mono/diheme cytochrome c family protein